MLSRGDRHSTPLWLTTLCGIVGALVGWIIYLVSGGNGSPGLDWDCWLLIVVGAAIPVAVAVMLTASRKIDFPH